ncbi:hypothetical protein [Leptolyngbya sp. PL-A3]
MFFRPEFGDRLEEKGGKTFIVVTKVLWYDRADSQPDEVTAIL